MKKNLFKYIAPFFFLMPMALTACTNEDSLSGEALKNHLHDRMYHTTFIEYNNSPKYFMGYYKNPIKHTDYVMGADEVPNRPGYIYLMYTGEEYPAIGSDFGSKLNREHVWPQSLFRAYSKTQGVNDYDDFDYPTPYSDLYNLRPCDGDVNEARSNYSFGVNENMASGEHFSPFDPKYMPSSFTVNNGYGDVTYNGVPGDETYRGEIARIIFYVATRYDRLVINDSNSGSQNSIGILSDLLAWNLAYPVTDREKVRNNQVEIAQGNRNLFVDNPAYACRIWGNTNDETRLACGLN